MQNNQENQENIKLGQINPEGISRASKKADRKKSSTFKKVIIVLCVVSGVVVGAWKGIPFVTGKLMVPTIPYSVTDTISANSNATFLDEVLEQQQKQTKEGQLSLLEEVKQLETYLDMYGKLEDLKLSSYTETVVEIEETETFNKDLEDKYREFTELLETTKKDVLSNDSLRLYSLAAELNGYKAIVDSKITTDGYDILADYGILVAKTAVLDASGISYMNIGNLRIPSETENYVIEYSDPDTDKVFKINIPSLSIIHRVISNVYSAQTKDTTDLTTEEIIKDLTKYLNDAKVATFMRYSNDESLLTTNTYDDVREIIESSKTK